MAQTGVRKYEMNRRNVISGLMLPMIPAVLGGSANNAAAQQASGFQFVVYGDSRPMMYLPSRSNQREEATKLLIGHLEK